MSIRNILVATDFSVDSEVALDTAIEFAKGFGATLHLLHAYVVWIPPLIGPVPIPADFVASARDAARERLEALAKRPTQAGVICRSHLSPLVPLEAILELAQSLPADLVAMGTRGLTGLKHVLLGSIAERVVRLAPCPVLTAKATSH